MSEHVSFSSLAQFDACPASWKARRIDHEPEPPSRARDTGILVHEVIAEYLTECAASEIDQYAAGIPEIVARVLKVDKRGLSTESLDDVMLICKGFAKRDRMVPEQLLGVEVELRVAIPDTDFELLCYIDRITNELDEHGPFVGIEDIKSGWASTQTDKHRFQLSLYAWAYHITRPNVRIKTRNLFARQGSSTNWEEMMEWDYDIVLLRMQTIIHRMVEAQTFQAFPATPNMECASCPIVTRCAEREAQGTIATQEQAEAALAEVVRLEASSGVLKDALRAWVDCSGEVVLKDMRAGYSEPSAAQTISVADALALGPEDMAKILKVDKTRLKKYLNDPRLEGAWREEFATPRFTVGKRSAK